MGAGCVSLGGGNTSAGSAGMFVSIDKGQNWEAISQYPTLNGVKQLSDTSVFRLVTDPQNPKTFYWLSRERGLFYSYDEGNTWRQDPGPLASGFVFGITIHPKDSCLLFGTNGERVYKTIDCGRIWTEMYRESRPGIQLAGVAFDPFNPEKIFAIENNGDLLLSEDNGVSWRVTHRFGVSLSLIEFDHEEAGRMYLATRNRGIYRSTDGGVTWGSLAHRMTDFPGALDYRRFFIHPERSKTMYWVSTYGILVSYDGGNNWQAIELITPPGSALIYGFAVNPKNDNEIYYTATINNRSTFYKSVDGGRNWITNKLPSGQVPTVLRVHPTREDILYLGFTLLPKQ